MKTKVTKLIAISLSLLALSACTPGNQTMVDQDPALSWMDGACSKSTQGVSLSVSYLGKVTTHCALDYSGNGWELFKAAGFEVKGTAKYPTAFACTIDGEPKSAKCDDSATSSAYWGYYVFTKGTWGYATTGAADHKSLCGDSEGWVYMETENTKVDLPTPVDYACN
ncbi:MAG: hypothetical protein RLY83_238 [Actinomycetota bacterium]